MTDKFVGVTQLIITFSVAIIAFATWKTANRQTDISQASIEIQRESMEVSNRAYLNIINPDLKIAENGRNEPSQWQYQGRLNQPIEMHFTIVNDGVTPAYNIYDSTNIKILLHQQRPDTIPDIVGSSYYPIYSPKDPNTRTIDSGKDYVIRSHFVKDSGFNYNRYGIYFWGRIEYDDVFNRPHWIEFCYEYDRVSKTFRPYGNCNNTDKE